MEIKSPTAREAKKKVSEIKWTDKLAEELHKPFKRKFKTRWVTVTDINDT